MFVVVLREMDSPVAVNVRHADMNRNFVSNVTG
jgi:hypothetical protein